MYLVESALWKPLAQALLAMFLFLVAELFLHPIFEFIQWPEFVVSFIIDFFWRLFLINQLFFRRGTAILERKLFVLLIQGLKSHRSMMASVCKNFATATFELYQFTVFFWLYAKFFVRFYFLRLSMSLFCGLFLPENVVNFLVIHDLILGLLLILL